MAINYPNYQFQTVQPAPQQVQQNVFSPISLFPQSVGNVYSLNSSSELGNLPTGNGLSVGLCMNDNILFIKSLQNGEPVFLTYRLSPISNQDDKLTNYLKSQEEKISNLESEIKKLKEKIGGKLEWQI